MFGIGIPELILILVVGLIVFGPSKLPEAGRALGKGLREFRKASSALQEAINAPDPPKPQQQTSTAAQSALRLSIPLQPDKLTLYCLMITLFIIIMNRKATPRQAQKLKEPAM